MAKKGRASTMTLKDFHGGSIPSDLQLPSAPGMGVDRSSYERQGSNAWGGNAMNRGYDRGSFHRQGYANGVRGFEDRPSYFPNTATIGRSYDEDERRPRSSPATEPYYKPSSEKLEKVGADPRYSLENGYKPRSPERLPYSSTYQNPGRLQQSSVVPPRTPPERPSNAWAARQPTEVPPAGSPFRARNSMARLAEASAIDKVASGRWQPGFVLERSRSSDSEKFYPGKDVVHGGYDESRKVETLQISHGYEPEFDGRRESFQQFENQSSYRGPDVYRGEYGVRGYNEGGRVAMAPEGRGYEHSESFRRESEQRFYDQEEKYRSGAREEERFRREEFHHRGPGYDRLEVHDDGGRYYMEPHSYHHPAEARVPAPGNRQQVYGGNSYENEAPPPSSYAQPPQRKSSGEWDRSRTPEFEQQQQAPAMENPEKSALLHRSSSGDRPKLKLLPRSRSSEEQDAPPPPEDGYSHDTSPDPEHERPKLSLKPRSQPLEPPVTRSENRQNLFGGARPRELVLKERGADDAVITGLEATPGNSAGHQEASRNVERPDSGKQVNRREQELMRSLSSESSERYDSRRDFGRQDRRDHHHQHQQQQQQHYLHHHQQQQQHYHQQPHHHHHQQQQQELKRDIDRQDSWRRPAAEPSPHSPLVEMNSARTTPGPGLYNSGVSGGSGGSSALQLAQAFSRSVNLSRSNTGSRLTDNSSPRYNNNNNNIVPNNNNGGTSFSKSNNNFVLNKQRPSGQTW